MVMKRSRRKSVDKQTQKTDKTNKQIEENADCNTSKDTSTVPSIGRHLLTPCRRLGLSRKRSSTCPQTSQKTPTVEQKGTENTSLNQSSAETSAKKAVSPVKNDSDSSDGETLATKRRRAKNDTVDDPDDTDQKSKTRCGLAKNKNKNIQVYDDENDENIPNYSTADTSLKDMSEISISLSPLESKECSINVIEDRAIKSPVENIKTKRSSRNKKLDEIINDRAPDSINNDNSKINKVCDKIPADSKVESIIDDVEKTEMKISNGNLQTKRSLSSRSNSRNKIGNVERASQESVVIIDDDDNVPNNITSDNKEPQLLSKNKLRTTSNLSNDLSDDDFNDNKNRKDKKVSKNDTAELSKVKVYQNKRKSKSATSHREIDEELAERKKINKPISASQSSVSSNVQSDSEDDFDMKKSKIVNKKPDKNSLRKQIDEMKRKIKEKQDRLEILKNGNAKIKKCVELQNVISTWRTACQNSLQELLEMNQSRTRGDKISMDGLLDLLHIPKKLVRYDSEQMAFN